MMRTRKWFEIASTIAIVGLLASCAPAAAPAPAATKAPLTAATPASKPVEPPAKAGVSPAAPAPSPKPAGEQAKYGGILNISHFSDPRSYDPIQETSLQSQSLIAPNYSGIVQHDPLEPAKVIGDLAESWDMSPDGLTYTFRLFKNVKWHDGNPFAAEDARYSLELVRKPPRGVISPRQEWLKAADKIEAPDKDTLKITLSYPSAAFLHNLADGRMLVVPQQVFEARGSMKRDIVGTGPYKFKSFTPGTSFSVVKNPDYFMKGRPYLDGITWYIIPDVATRFAALRTHRVQATAFTIQGLSPSQSEILRREFSDKVDVQRYPGLSFLAFWMPVNKAPWNDIRVRRAIDLTIDRPKVIKVAAQGVADIGSYMPPGVWGLPEFELLKLPGYRQSKDADIAEAKKLMAEAGYAQGIKTTTVTRNQPPMDTATISLKEQLAQIGVDISINLQEMAKVYDVIDARNYDSMVFAGTASFDDPDQIFGQNLVSGVPRNLSDFSDATFDKMYDEQSRALDMAKRKEIVLNMQRRLHELVPAFMLYWYVMELGSWKEVRDFKPGIGLFNNLKFQNVWLAK